MKKDLKPESLLEEFPSGYFVCDLQKFEDNYRRFLSAFSRHYPNTRIAYSYKTNYLPALCKRIDDLGGYAEVVSGLEYRIAQKYGIHGSNIIFNGPLKTDEDLLEAGNNNSIINLECDSEIDRLGQLAKINTGIEFRVGIRCNINPGGESRSRFGFDTESPDFFDRIERIQRINGVSLTGLHCHFIPEGRSAENYGLIALRMAGLGREIWGIEGPEFIDMGGGYFSEMPPEIT